MSFIKTAAVIVALMPLVACGEDEATETGTTTEAVDTGVTETTPTGTTPTGTGTSPTGTATAPTGA